MGEVWKALDLLQDAGGARDKYVAIKFINHEIRNHPYALKALVREFSRYKKLIHPNIVKAYELNRDKNEIFIVMEYLEGSSLKEFIELHPKGISLSQAQPIIKGMCDALEYAHKEGIVHLDFKPGNVFYDKATQTCKVIDFGIARLSNREERDKTHFDPGSLGAISTAYASNEMLLEAEPDSRDDIYGLACIIYELLSGHHPFDKNLSIQAEREKIKPDQISMLNKNEFQALLHGLDFHRNNRTASAAHLYYELFPPFINEKQNHTKWLIIAAAMILTVFSIYKGYNRWQFNQVKTDIEQQSSSTLDGFISLSIGEQQEILRSPTLRLALAKYTINQKKPAINALNLISQFEPKIQQTLLNDKKVRIFLITHFSKKIDQEIKDGNFKLAKNNLLRILEQYPDSMQLTRQFNKILLRKQKRLTALQQRYQQCLKDNSKKLTELYPCLQETQVALNNIDSTNSLIASPELTSRYNKEIFSAISHANFPLAEKLLANWYALDRGESKSRKDLEEKLIRAIYDKKQIQKASVSNDIQKINRQLSSQPSQSGNLSQHIDRLLKQAEQQVTKKQLMTPFEDSAWKTYQKILISDPNNKPALKGINKISQIYVLWAREEIKRNNLKHAEYLFNKALEVSPGNQNALSGVTLLKVAPPINHKEKIIVEKELARLGILTDSRIQQQSPPIKKNLIIKEPQTELAKLLSKAKQQITQKQLITPARSNAWKTYQDVLIIDPNNKQAMQGINKISAIYIQRAKEKIKKGNYNHAGYLFNKALLVSPGNKEALSGLSSLNKQGK
jgi:serine/threonine protein kinase